MNTLQETIEDFKLLESVEEKYQYLIQIGDKLPVFDPNFKKPENLVKGCTSRVWMSFEKDNLDYQFNFDSDSRLVKGILYLLFVSLQNLNLYEVKNLKFTTLQEIGLYQNISINRKIGLEATVNKVRSYAA